MACTQVFVLKDLATVYLLYLAKNVKIYVITFENKLCVYLLTLLIESKAELSLNFVVSGCYFGNKLFLSHRVLTLCCSALVHNSYVHSCLVSDKST